MTETQKELFKLISEIDDICTRHDIAYYLAGGTMIGALRHKGFIPWDDDLDIMMTRDNWLKFIEVCKTEIPPDRILEGQETNRDYTNTFGRYTDTSATSIHKTEVLGGGSTGFVIDVFPLDPIPDEQTMKQYFEDMLLYSDLINPGGLYSWRFGINKDRYFEALERMKKEGKEAVLSDLESRMFCYKEEDCDFYIMRWGGLPFMFEKSMFGNSRREEFEGRQFMVPDKASDYLVRHFGDEWTTIPPHDEQMEHEALFNLEIDYKRFQDDYMPLVDVENVRKQWLRRKEYIFDAMEDRLNASRKKGLILAELRRLEIMKKLDETEIDIQEAVATGKYDELSDLFSDYYTAQGSRTMIGREDFGGIRRFFDPLFIELPDDVFYAAIITLINTNRISKAARLIDVREHVKGELTAELADARSIIVKFRNIITDYDLGNVKGSMSAAEELYKDYPEMKSIEMFLCRVFMETDNYEKAKLLLDKCLRKYHGEGYFTKILGDYYLKADNNTEKAVGCYEEARATTDNGMTLLEIDEFMESFNGK